MRLQRVIYKALLRITRGLLRITWDHNGLQGITNDYKGGLLRITLDYKGLQGMTQDYNGATKDYSGLQWVTRHY